MANTVTIFGGTGFVGRYVVDRLADAGYTVRIASRRPAAANFLRVAGTVGQVVSVPCNIFDQKSIASVVKGSDSVINLIGILAEKGKQTFTAIHTEFPTSLAKISAESGVKRLVHVSALGASESGSSRYSQSKKAGEDGLLSEFPTATILRPSVIFGPEDGFFNLFATMAQYSPVLPLVGGGKTMFQPVYVANVADAIVKIVTSAQAIEGKIFELGGPQKLSFKECLQKILSITGQKAKLVTVPFALARIQGKILQNLPGQLLTVDQVASLTVDNIISDNSLTLHDLGIEPTPMDMILPSYLARYRAGGRFSARHQESK